MHTLSRIILTFRYVVSTYFTRHALLLHVRTYIRNEESERSGEDRRAINKSDVARRTTRRSLKYLMSTEFAGYCNKFSSFFTVGRFVSNKTNKS